MSVLVRTYEAPPVSRREIFRYMRCGVPTTETEALVESCLAEAMPLFSYRACYCRTAIARTKNGILLGETLVHSADLEKNLQGCNEMILLAATVGLPFDRLLARYTRLSPARALCLQAIGTERVEALCDTLQEELRKEINATGQHLRPRFSPGYGDLPLELQRDVFSLLQPEKHLGLTLRDSLLMSPTKSVTAITGIEVKP